MYLTPCVTAKTPGHALAFPSPSSMSPIIPSRKAFHQRLPSDDDLQKNNPSGSSTELLPPARWKGKGKAKAKVEAKAKESEVASEVENDEVHEQETVEEKEDH